MAHHTFLRRSERARIRRAAFSLIELLVVTGVLVVVSAVVLANNAQFGGAITLKNLVYDMALSVRQAQTFGISVRKFGSGAGEFGAGYGVHFQISSPNEYIVFADAVTANGIYDSAGEIVESISINGNYDIVSLCAIPAGGSVETCGYDSLDILFKRPEPDAYIRINGGSTLYQGAKIKVRSPRNDEASVFIEATGQISVQ